ncbi:YrzI family small protein, partial [Bacillus toyonensis]
MKFKVFYLTITIQK